MNAPTRRRLVLAIAAAAIVAGVLWLRSPPTDATAQRPGARDAPTERHAATAAGPAYPPAFPSSGVAAERADTPRELCGYGIVNPQQLPRDVSTAAQRFLQGLEQRLAQAAEPQRQALGLALQVQVARSRAIEEAHRSDPQCYEKQECFDRLVRDSDRGAAPAAEQLARLASVTRDPRVYAAALYACQTLLTGQGPLSPACGALDPARWTALDPDNASAWLGVAAARRRAGGDMAALDEAMERASRARFVDARNAPFADLLPEAAGESDPVRTVVALQIADAFARQTVFAGQSMVVVDYCRADALADEHRRRRCHDLATLLAERGQSLMDLLVGVRVGELAGWSAPRVAQLQAERKALTDLALTGDPGWDLTSCDGQARLGRWLQGVTKAGELAHLRDLAAHGQGAPR